MDNILILGGNGFIGKNIIERFLLENFEIFVLNRKQDSLDHKFFFDPRIIVIEGELAETELIINVIAENNIKLILHLVSSLIPSSSNGEFYNEFNQVIIPTFKLLDFISKKGIKFVFFSSGGTVYGKSDSKLCEKHSLEPINFYGYSKLVIEDYINLQSRVNNLSYIIFRPSNVYGKYQRLEGQQGFIAVALGKIFSNQSIDIWGDGNSIRDYVYVQDVADVVFQVIKSGKSNLILNIGSGIGISLIEIIELFKVYFDHQIRISFKDKRPVDLDNMVLDIKELKSVINFNPISVEKGLQNFIEYLNGKDYKK